jgi:hypothetical protein
MLSLAPLVLSGLIAVSPLLPESVALDSPTRHVRSVDRSIAKLLARGYRHSPTFAGLISQLQESDVFVYIEEVPRLPAGLEGRMMMLPRAHEHRYVRIQIALRGAPEDSIAIIGHELQHALEIAGAPDVGDQDTMTRLYERIGVRGGDHVYDTIAAQEMGRTVRKELLA